MIKLFQVIEILSKFVYIPVVYSGKIKSFLISISGMAGPIEINPEIFIEGKVQDGYMNYKGKIFNSGEYANILQSMPISISFYLFLELILLILSCIYIKKGKSRKSGVSSFKKLVLSMQIFFIEANIIDFWFSALLNITVSPRISPHSFQSTVAFFVSSYILTSILYKYINIFLKVKQLLEKNSQSYSKGVDDFTIEIGFEGLKSSSLIRVNHIKLKMAK